jgi:hypothetical protein
MTLHFYLFGGTKMSEAISFGSLPSSKGVSKRGIFFTLPGAIKVGA